MIRSDARQAKAEGMARVDKAANKQWQGEMYEYLIKVALNHAYFTSDDVEDMALRCGMTVQTHDKRAFGPVMMRAAKQGVCEKANCAPIPSRRRSLHASPRAVWRSLLYMRTHGQTI